MKNKSHDYGKEKILCAFMGFSLFLSSCSGLNLREIEHSEKNEKNPEVVYLASDSEAEAEKRIEYDEDIKPNGNHEIRAEAVEWIEYYEKSNGEGSADKIILNYTQINEYNAELIKDNRELYDMTKMPEYIDGEEVKKKICKYSLPNTDKYDKNGNIITADVKNNIYANRALDEIPETVKPRRAIITDRCNLRGMPTDIEFYSQSDKYYDALQETELIIGFPVFVLHESEDSRFLFVQSYYYAGWVNKDYVGFADAQEFEAYVSAEKFVVVTEPEITIGDKRLSMGAKLPYISESDTHYKVLLPSSNGGEFKPIEAEIDKNNSNFGYLAYNMKNYYRQTFSYLESMYSWGGADGGVDCSGFVCAVFRTFGIYLPRNTGEQKLYNGDLIDLVGLSATQMTDKFREISFPASIHRPGHVMLYLGYRDGSIYVIHAPRGGQRVSVMQLYLPDTITNICLIK